MRISSSLPVENLIFPKTSKTETASTESFSEKLSNLLQNVEEAQESADELTAKLITGDVENVHQVMAAAEQAKLMLQLTVQVRNKIVDAYQEIMRMQV
ncbi:MAG: flagellar hook-basal body complex protein FliE [Bacillota bacterium]|jgi:flagellar hook-basal body complex protein FliE